MTPKLLSTAYRLAAEAHEGQINKDGTPYITHPLRLAAQCTDPVLIAIALLHDVLEDTWVPLGLLEERGFGPEVIEPVKLLTRPKGKNTEEDYFLHIADISSNASATAIKILDLEDNMNLLRLQEVGEWELKRTAKYHRAWRILRAARSGEPEPQSFTRPGQPF